MLKTKTTRPVLVAVIACWIPVTALIFQRAALAGDKWPSFQNGGNTSVKVENVPLKWSPESGIAWKIRLPGYGQSAPVVWEDRVYVTAVQGDQKEVNLVLALEGATGELLWQHELAASTKTKNSYMVSRAAPTPLADANGVYVLFESGDLHAFSHAGKTRWHRVLFDDAERAFQNGHGYGASPAQTEDSVVVLVDHRGPSYLAAFDKHTGKPLWKTPRTSRSSWSSPHIANVSGNVQIIVSSAGTVDGYDAKTGEQLWSHEGLTGNLIPSATIKGDRIYVGASVGRDEGNASSAAESNCCLKITPGKEPGYQLLWHAEKAICDYTSPLVHEGHVYYLNKVGVLTCLDATTGRELYRQRIGSPCWAQPIAVRDRIYFFGKRGETTILQGGSKLKVLHSNHLWKKDAPPSPLRSYEYEPVSEDDSRPRNPSQEYLDPIVYGVAAVDNALYVRLGTHLYCIGGSAAQSR